MLKILEKREVLSAKTLHIEVNPSGRAFISIKNNSGPSTDPCGTTEFTFLYSDVCPFKTTLCSQF